MSKDAKKVKATNQEFNVENMIDDLVRKANIAKEEMLKLDQEATDKIVEAMAKAGLDKHIELARLAVNETGRGIFEDKVTKNMFATEYIYNSIKYKKTVGVIEENEEDGYMMVAEPIGVVAGVTPVTNPTSTTMFKTLISMKGRNPIIFSFHPSAQKCSAEAARILRDAAIEAGAPENCVQWIEVPSLEASAALMKHPGVSLILATGGPGMVKSAYSSGKPALGVGAGNVPCFIEKSADIKQAVNDTKGQIITYNGEPIVPLYFSTSSGKTENSEEVFSTEYPYLKSVDSPYDKYAPKYASTLKISNKDFVSKLQNTYSGININQNDLSSQVKILSRSNGGSVAKIKLGNKELTGRDIRNILNLNSANFEIKFGTNSLDFVVKGYGHGVGMSQWGANGMAEEGYKYYEILSHYYKDTTIKDLY